MCKLHPDYFDYEVTEADLEEMDEVEIGASWICDGVVDCSEEEDEEGC